MFISQIILLCRCKLSVHVQFSGMTATYSLPVAVLCKEGALEKNAYLRDARDKGERLI